LTGDVDFLVECSLDYINRSAKHLPSLLDMESIKDSTFNKGTGILSLNYLYNEVKNIQVDIILTPNIELSKFFYYSAISDNLKGLFRNSMLSAIHNIKMPSRVLNYRLGSRNKANPDDVITNPDDIIFSFFGCGYSTYTLSCYQDVLFALMNNYNEAEIQDVYEYHKADIDKKNKYLSKFGKKLKFPEKYWTFLK
jgi:hypothetical protein